MRTRLLLLVLAVAAIAPAAVAPFGPETWFVPDALPQKVTVEGNPLDYCGARIGLDVRNVELPRGWEGGYRFACRFPIIDYVSNRPLYMKQWAEDNSALIVREQRRKGVGALISALDILRGTGGVGAITGTPDSAMMEQLTAQLKASRLTPDYQADLLELVEDFLKARSMAVQATAQLMPAEVAFLDSNPGYFLAPDGKKMPELTGNVESQFRFIEVARKVRYECIFEAAQVIAGAVADYVHATRDFKPDDFVQGPMPPFEFALPGGLLRVTGLGTDTTDADALLEIDLGGNDLHWNSAGTCAGSGRGAALCIDHGGDDVYQAGDKKFVQGTGFLGVGLLVDLAGNDRYYARHFSQGCGIVGVGAIWDRAGDDVYDGHTFVQGAGMFGLGMILDDAGKDLYDCANAGQGSATTLGLGVLSDLAGDDQYRMGKDTLKDALGGLVGYGQGGALSFRGSPWEGKLTAYGGVGMLVDDQGDDTYDANGWNDQGGSYIMSLGVLVDNAGNDRYQTGTGQGSGIHVTNAILIDRAGNDVYQGGFRTGGSGGDRSPSFLIDYAGNDKYVSGTSSFGSGCKPFCFSLMIDYAGADTYVSPEPKGRIRMNNWDSFGGVWPESEPYLWPYAICLDLGGKDDYQVRNHANDTERGSFGHGIHLDMEWSGGDVIGPVAHPLPEYEPLLVPEGGPMPMHEYLKDILRLHDPDNFTRFQAVGRIVNEGPTVVPILVSTLLESEDRQFNRDVLECLHYLMVRKRVEPASVPILALLLKAQDPEVRTIVADDFGVFRIGESSTPNLTPTLSRPAGAGEGGRAADVRRGRDSALVAAMDDSVASVRRFALRSLASLKSKAGAEGAWRTLGQPEYAVVSGDYGKGYHTFFQGPRDPSEDVRRVAVRYLAAHDTTSYARLRLFTVLEANGATSVRCAAAEALGRAGERWTEPVLRDAAQSPDVYLQRAATRALCDLGYVEGIGLLIESLTFPSIDAFYNYDRNVPNDIAAYANYDFPEATRYEQDTWRAWFRVHKDSIDIKANAGANRALRGLSESLGTAAETLQIQAYEDLIQKYPDYRRIRKSLAAKLNGVAWNMVTAAPGSTERNLVAGLKYARRMVELDDSDPNYWDTLIEALVVNGLEDEALKLCREMGTRYPGNSLFTERVKKLEK